MDKNEQNKVSCDPTISRKEFLTTLVRRAAIAGSLLAAPAILDKFLVPPVHAHTSTRLRLDTRPGQETNPFRDT